MEEEIIRYAYERCLENRERYSTCNKRKVGAALILPDDKISAYFGVNGDLKDPCNKKGKDYCIREDDGHSLEYFTCPSPCAEGSAIIKALSKGKSIKGSTIVSTDFPCERCTGLIIDGGISELYFGNFKNGEPKLGEIVYIGWMVREHVSVNQILSDGIGNYNNWGLLQSPIFTLSIGTSGNYYFPYMIDPKSRKEHVKKIRELNEEMKKLLR